MFLRGLGRLMLAFAATCLALAACTDGQDATTRLAMVPTDLEPTAVPTTAPLALPTVPTPSPTPEPTVAAAVAAAPAVAAAAPLPATATAAPAATAPPATAIPATAVPATAIPATAVPATPTTVPQPTAVPATAVPTAAPVPTTASTPVPTTAAAVAPTAGPTSTNHAVTERGYVTLGKAGATWITMPAGRIELIGFHEAGHPGSQAINAAATGLPMMVLESRGRGTPARSAADIVVPPGEPLRAPVTGTVVAAKTYVLYCEYEDKLVYIEPDGLPGYQVRLFHVRGDLPAVGTRVIAGETIVATGGANPLPFESQVDEFTGEPSWPHTHVEVVDTSIPDTRPPGPGC